MIKRYCLTTETHEGPNSYIISRPSILGNPYSHLPEDKCLAIYRCKTRDEAIDAYSRSIGMKFGIGYINLEEGEFKGPIAKFLTEEQKAEALAKAEETGLPAVALELPNGKIVTGKTTDLLGASAALLLNALKALAGIDKDVLLIPGNVIEPVQTLKTDYLGNHNPRLHTDEVLIALSICAATNDVAKKALDQVPKLKGLEAHSSVILSSVDVNTFKKLGVNITFEPKYQTKKLFHG